MGRVLCALLCSVVVKQEIGGLIPGDDWRGCSHTCASVASNIIIILIITDLYSAFRSEDTEALDAAQED